MKIYINDDEWYPVYYITQEKDFCIKEVEITKTQYEWLKKVFQDFEKAQDFLKQL